MPVRGLAAEAVIHRELREDTRGSLLRVVALEQAAFAESLDERRRGGIPGGEILHLGPLVEGLRDGLAEPRGVRLLRVEEAAAGGLLGVALGASLFAKLGESVRGARPGRGYGEGDQGGAELRGCTHGSTNTQCCTR